MNSIKFQLEYIEKIIVILEKEEGKEFDFIK